MLLNIVEFVNFLLSTEERKRFNFLLSSEDIGDIIVAIKDILEFKDVNFLISTEDSSAIYWR